jgi:hypothetical protein
MRCPHLLLVAESSYKNQSDSSLVAFRKKLYSSLDELQADLDAWLRYYNEERPHSGRYCYGTTPMQTWRDSKPLVEEKMLERQHQPVVVHYEGQPAVA